VSEKSEILSALKSELERVTERPPEPPLLERGPTHVVESRGKVHLAILAHYTDLEAAGFDMSGYPEDTDFWIDPTDKSIITQTWVGERSFVLPDKEKWTLNTPD
jgi:hypothetical protein